ncbi:phosphopantothenoylcysteine decarboxylase/phosphopantothenate--cysteine ligase [Neomicrococcus aestuarii]|uniref:Coenzyme A biosynthesis bifunctional protein CoaBC n=1 Tax=Neomicrococcus aestuarii TaxID=556325 RepID=A0A7W8TSA8_9MICC|nr:bifunctional phosphopantothenoylcysteine decarboxylase/phosphopantothenate--cysteine ligase CoaBC [Neomicrococcus aestuarii]MBB5511989.1 phosphopantothenoylcysteine decarboxylase/phosphopantothenate--cysteine ligase [Neomicrococcus aestuarii]
MARIVLGVSGGIAAYKVASLLRLYREAGHDVDVIPTRNSLEFVGRATWEALSGRTVTESVFQDIESVRHVRLGQEADLVVIAPATADVLARAATGQANDLLSATLLTAHCPVVFAPAMHTEMWLHPATQANVATLRSRGCTVIDPADGRLTGKDSGPGRLPEPSDLFDATTAVLEAHVRTTQAASSSSNSAEAEVPSARPFEGKIVTISAGGTREPLDPVRFLGNRSSGRQGVAIAQAALDAGADVRFVAAHMDVPAPEGVILTTASTALELHEAVFEAARGADVLIMNAAVADFRPSEYADSKIKKQDDHADPIIHLVRNPDILADVVAERDANDFSTLPPLIVGFAAETGDTSGSVLEYGAAKLARKGCEMLVVNQVGQSLVFGQDTNSVTILSADGTAPVEFSGTKSEVAEVLLETIAARVDSQDK